MLIDESSLPETAGRLPYHISFRIPRAAHTIGAQSTLRRPMQASFGTFAAIFFPGRHAAADMALGLVLLQDCLDLQIQGPVQVREPFTDVLMYGGLTDVKFLGGLPHGGPSFDDVLGETDGPVLR